MRQIQTHLSQLAISVVAITLLSVLPLGNNVVAAELKNVAFPEKSMIRLSSYNITDAKTDIAVFTSSGLGVGTAVSFDKDLGGEDSVTTSRIDGYYRFNERHRIDFSSYSTDRQGSQIIDIDIDLGDKSYVVGDTINSQFKIDLIRLGYAYSFYHSPTVELSLSTGLNISNYDFESGLADGTASTSSKVSAPLPTFGLRMAYKISQNWSIHYVSETFFIEIDDSIEGTLLNYELDVEYRFDNGFTLGAGIARTSADLTIDDGEWKGSVNDSNRGYMLYGAYYF